MKRIIFAALFAAYVLLIHASTSCSPLKNGCPGATSQGRVPGKFKG